MGAQCLPGESGRLRVRAPAACSHSLYLCIDFAHARKLAASLARLQALPMPLLLILFPILLLLLLVLLVQLLLLLLRLLLLFAQVFHPMRFEQQ